MSDVIDANIYVHTQLVDKYESDEPHFRPENQAKVSGRLAKLRSEVPGGRLLDLGCGTGFIINIARHHFDSIRGVDITPAMLARVNTDGHDIEVTEGRVENLPFGNDEFDALSAYSFLDHLEDPGAMLKEAHRVMKSGGAFYIDLVPNALYWQALGALTENDFSSSSAFVQREFGMVTANDQKMEQEYGVDPDKFRRAEPMKEAGGVDADNFRELAASCGFSVCEIHFDWFLGNAKALHQQPEGEAKIIDSYLQEALPLTSHLYKYVYFILRKD